MLFVGYKIQEPQSIEAMLHLFLVSSFPAQKDTEHVHSKVQLIRLNVNLVEVHQILN